MGPWGLPPPAVESEHKAVLIDRFSIIHSYVLIRTCLCFRLNFPQAFRCLSLLFILRSKYFFCYKKKNKISRALSPFCLDAARIALEWLFPFFLLFGSFEVLCFFFSYLISVLVCAMWYQETAGPLLSYEKAAEKNTSFIM